MDVRGEQKFRLGAVDFKMSMEYLRIVAIEETTGIGIISLAGRFTHLMGLENSETPERDLMLSPVHLTHVAICLYELTGHAQSVEGFGAMILKVGLIKAIEPLSEFFAEAIAGAPMGESEPANQESVMDDSP